MSDTSGGLGGPKWPLGTLNPLNITQIYQTLQAIVQAINGLQQIVSNLKTPTKPIFNVTTFTSVGNYQALSTDNFIIVQKATGGVTQVTPPASPSTNQFLSVIDGKGDAGTNNITISGTIGGVTNPVIGSNYGALTMIYGAGQWNIFA